MKTATHYQTRLDNLNRELEEYLYPMAHALRGSKESMEVQVAHYQVRLGEYEPLINGYPLLESLRITTEGLFLQLELIEEYAAFGEITTLSISDKIEILRVLQSEVLKTHNS